MNSQKTNFFISESHPKSPIEQLGYLAACLFSIIIICVIAFFVLDEANARFATIAFSVIIVLLTRPLAYSNMYQKFKWFGWLIDGALATAFVWSTWWFFQVKEELWAGFYMATPMNLLAGLAGIITIVLLTLRAWGWSLIIMALIFIFLHFRGRGYLVY